MTARVHDLSLRLALRRSLVREVRAFPALANEAANDRIDAWLEDELLLEKADERDDIGEGEARDRAQRHAEGRHERPGKP